MECVQYSHTNPHRYDGTSEYQCVNERCNMRIGRFCSKELLHGEVEPRYCNGQQAHPKPKIKDFYDRSGEGGSGVPV